jgi:hypothetical protein
LSQFLFIGPFPLPVYGGGVGDRGREPEEPLLTVPLTLPGLLADGMTFAFFADGFGAGDFFASELLTEPDDGLECPGLNSRERWLFGVETTLAPRFPPVV